MPVIPITKAASPTPENIKILNAALTSLIAGHAQSIEPWTFYEEVDHFLVRGAIAATRSGTEVLLRGLQLERENSEPTPKRPIGSAARRSCCRKPCGISS